MEFLNLIDIFPPLLEKIVEILDDCARVNQNEIKEEYFLYLYDPIEYLLIRYFSNKIN